MEVRSLTKEFSGEAGEKLQEIISFKWGTDYPVELSVRQEVAEKLERFKFPVAEKGASKTTRVVYKLDEERASNLYVVNLEGGSPGLYTIGLVDKNKTTKATYTQYFVEGVAQSMFSAEDCQDVMKALSPYEQQKYQPTNGYNLSQLAYSHVFGKDHPTTAPTGGKRVFFFALYEKSDKGFDFVGIFIHSITKDRVKFLKDNKPDLYPDKMIKDRAYPLRVKGGMIPSKTYTFSTIDYVNGEDLPADKIREAIPAWNAFMDEYEGSQANLRRKYIRLVVNGLKMQNQTKNSNESEDTDKGDYGLDDEIGF